MWLSRSARRLAQPTSRLNESAMNPTPIPRSYCCPADPGRGGGDDCARRWICVSGRSDHPRGRLSASATRGHCDLPRRLLLVLPPPPGHLLVAWRGVDLVALIEALTVDRTDRLSRTCRDRPARRRPTRWRVPGLQQRHAIVTDDGDVVGGAALARRCHTAGSTRDNALHGVATVRGLWSEDPRKQRLMKWLITPRSERQPPTQNGLADDLGVHSRSVRMWMSRPDFRADWDREARNVIGSPERVQEVLNTLFRAATDPHNRHAVAAAKLYLEATNSIKPPAIEVKARKPSELSDDELDALLAQGALEVVKERQNVVEPRRSDGKADDAAP